MKYITYLLLGIFILSACDKKKSTAATQPSEEAVRQEMNEAANKMVQPMVEELGKMMGADNPENLKAWGFTEMHRAASLGQVDKLRALIKAGKDVNARDKFGQTPLHLAAAGPSGQDCVPVLLAAGADVNAVDNRGTTTLMRVVSCGPGDSRETVVRQLISAKADVNAADSEGNTILHMVAGGMGDDDYVPLLLTAGANVNAKDKSGITPLMKSVCRGTGDLSDTIVRQLIAAKADVNATDPDGDTALHLACERGNAQMAKALIEAGAKVDAVNKLQRTPLLSTARNGWDESIKVLLEAKANVNARDKKGWSALALAANTPYWDAYKLLEAAGAKEESWTPLHLAAMNNDEVSIGKSLKQGLKVDSRDRYGRTPLMWAAIGSADKSAKLLIESHADVNAVDMYQLFAVHHACRVGTVNVLKLLIAAKANLNVKDVDGNTPLHMAVMNGREELVPRLIKDKVAINIQNNQGRTPIMATVLAMRGAFTKERESLERVGLMLLDAGADAQIADNQSQKPMDVHLFSSAFRTRLEQMSAGGGEQKLERGLNYYTKSPRAATILPKTPRDVVRRMTSALWQADRPTFVGCFSGTDVEMKLIGCVYDGSQSMIEFRRMLIASYGPKAMEEFNTGNGKLILPAIAEDSEIAALSFEVTNDRASSQWVWGKGVGDHTNFIQKNGEWFISLETVIQPPATAEGMMKMLTGMNQAVKEVQSQIGKPGMTPKELSKQFGKEMMEKVFGITIKN